MSTTTDKKIAVKYGQDWDKGRGLNHVLELPMDSLNRKSITSGLAHGRTRCTIITAYSIAVHAAHKFCSSEQLLTRIGCHHL